MKISLFRTHRAKRLLVLPKKYVALPAALLCICALCLLTTLPASVTTAATERQLPIYSVERDGKLCSLTFDAAWGNEDTQTLIDILDHYGVKATFFVVGQWVEKYPESVRALADAGHEVMCHSDDHAHFNTLSAQEIIDDVNTCCGRIESVTGVRPTLFRPPFGEYDDHVVATLRAMGMEVIQWDVEALAAGASGVCAGRSRLWAFFNFRHQRDFDCLYIMAHNVNVIPLNRLYTPCIWEKHLHFAQNVQEKGLNRR